VWVKKDMCDISEDSSYSHLTCWQELALRNRLQMLQNFSFYLETEAESASVLLCRCFYLDSGQHPWEILPWWYYINIINLWNSTQSACYTSDLSGWIILITFIISVLQICIREVIVILLQYYITIIFVIHI
jgi:hypothetical protein